MIALPYRGIRQGPHMNWCWAAVTAGVLNFYRQAEAVRMCEVVSAVRADACCEPVPARCEKRAALDRSLGRFGVLAGMRSGVIALRATSAGPSIEAEITSGRPIGVGLSFGITDHFCVIFGFDPQTGSLALADPFFDDALAIGYTELRTDYRNGGRWVASYLTMRPQA